MASTPYFTNLPSPCVGVCVMNPTTNLCEGCMRTIEEIGEWGGADYDRRVEITKALRQRRIAAGRTSDSDQRPRRRQRRGSPE